MQESLRRLNKVLLHSFRIQSKELLTELIQDFFFVKSEHLSPTDDKYVTNYVPIESTFILTVDTIFLADKLRTFFVLKKSGSKFRIFIQNPNPPASVKFYVLTQPPCSPEGSCYKRAIKIPSVFSIKLLSRPNLPHRIIDP